MQRAKKGRMQLRRTVSLSLSKSLLLLFVLIALTTSGYFLFRSKNENSFPDLPGGTYVGTISGLSQDSSEEFPFYIEKFNGVNNLLVVIFSSKWKPQVISLKSNSLLGDYSSLETSFAPIDISNTESSFLLYGQKNKNNFSGEVLSSHGEKGNWSLESISIDKLKLTGDPDFDLKEWLHLRTIQKKLSNEVNTILSNLQEQENKFQKLSKFVDEDGQILKDKAKTKRDSISSEINKVAEERKQITQQIKQSLNDLYLLNQMSKRGQAAEIARRISTKENDFFNISWGNVANPAVLEEQLAEQENINLEKLNENYKKALEIEQLKQNIREEENKIAQLEQKLTQGSDTNLDTGQLDSEENQNPAPSLLPKAKTKNSAKEHEKEKGNDWWNIFE